MPTDELIRTILSVLAFQMPLIVIACVGLWFAASRKTSLAHVSIWARWGFSLMIAYSLASVALAVMTLQLRIDAVARSSPQVFREDLFWLSLLGVAAYALLVIGIALTARAVFLDRK